MKNIFFISMIAVSTVYGQQNTDEVKVVGAMKNVMWKGELQGKIHLDTISEKAFLIGLGPVENLSGEITIINGKAFKSIALDETTMIIEETFDVKAPFFVYANVPNWKEQILPDSIQTLEQLEIFLDTITKQMKRPFAFGIRGIVDSATIHIVNLPPGSKVSSPEDAHNGKINYQLKNVKSDLVGFFSTEHKTIFTHHDTFMHIHLITVDRTKMGHLDEVYFKKGTMKLFLPGEL